MNDFIKSMQYRQAQLDQLKTSGLRLQETQDPGWVADKNVLTHPQHGTITMDKAKGEFTHEKPGPSSAGTKITKPISDLSAHLKQSGHGPEFKMTNGHTTTTKPLADCGLMVKSLKEATKPKSTEPDQMDELARLMSGVLKSSDWGHK